MITRQQLPVADSQDRCARIVAIAREPDHVAIAALDLHDDGRLFDALKLDQRVTQFRRPLELQTLGRRRHHGAYTTRHFLRLAVQELHDVADHRAVVAE